MKPEHNQKIEILIEMAKDSKVCMLITYKKNAENLSADQTE